MPPLSFGPALQLCRTRAGLSLSGLSGLVHYSRSYLSRVESGERRPTPRLAQLCDAALGADGALSGLVPPRAEQRPRPPEPGDGSRSGPPARPAPCPVATSAADDGDDARSAAHLTVHLTELRRLAQRVAPSPVLQHLSSAVGLLETLAGTARTPAVRHDHLELLAHYCDFAGWMAQESGNEPEAERWIARTESLAVEAGAFDLAHHTLIRRACLALYRGDGTSVTEYAVEAGRLSTGSTRVRAQAALREAQGLALNGRSDPCGAALDRAAELLDAAVESGRLINTATEPAGRGNPATPVIGSELTPRIHGLVRGWCLYDLGRPDEAAAALRTDLDRLPARVTRFRALFTARLALSLAASSELGAAVAVVDGLLKDSEGLCSHSVRTQLRLLAEVLRRRRTRPDIPELRARVAAALHCPGCATPG